MPIPASQARQLFTQKLIDVYQQRNVPTSFMRSFFPVTVTSSRYVSIEVERMGEKIAVDVLRGTEGNRNRFSRSTQKIFEPAFYREFFDATELELYNQVLGATGEVNSQLFVELMNDVAHRLGILQDMIERSIEIQCAQVLETGIVTTKYGNVDYKRKAESLVDVGGDYFATNSDPYAVFLKGCKFLRQVGRSIDGTFNAILGDTAHQHLLANTVLTGRNDITHMPLDGIVGPARNSVGGTYHGTIVCGSFRVNLWTYPHIYDDANGDPQPYVNDKKVVLIPANPRFKLAFAAVPQLIPKEGTVVAPQTFKIGEFIDERKARHEFDIQAAPLAIPVAVDQIYTFKAVTG